MRATKKTAQGWDMTFATNHLGPFALTEALVPLLPDGAGMIQERPFSGNTRVLQRGRDRARVVAGHSEAGRCRYAGVTDPGYNCR